MKYAEAIEITTVFLRDRQSRGEQYRSDVAETAARAAADTVTLDKAVNAIENAFLDARIGIT